MLIGLSTFNITVGLSRASCSELIHVNEPPSLRCDVSAFASGLHGVICSRRMFFSAIIAVVPLLEVQVWTI
jgi:hypothetical protein